MDNVTSSDMTLSWEAPADDGGSLVTGYYVEKRQGYSNRCPTSTVLVSTQIMTCIGVLSIYVVNGHTKAWVHLVVGSCVSTKSL